MVECVHVCLLPTAPECSPDDSVMSQLFRHISDILGEMTKRHQTTEVLEGAPSASPPGSSLSLQFYLLMPSKRWER